MGIHLGEEVAVEAQAFRPALVAAQGARLLRGHQMALSHCQRHPQRRRRPRRAERRPRAPSACPHQLGNARAHLDGTAFIGVVRAGIW